MAKGSAPTHSVLIPVNFTGRDGNERTKWFEVGSAWDNGGGKFNFNLVTSPGINFQIVPNKAWDDRKKATAASPEEAF